MYFSRVKISIDLVIVDHVFYGLVVINTVVVFLGLLRTSLC